MAFVCRWRCRGSRSSITSGAESGCGDCENAAPGPEVDGAVAGPDVLGERSQHQASRGVTAAAEGMPGSITRSMNRPVGSGSIQGGRTWKRPAR